jgi:hypothetical protein
MELPKYAFSLDVDIIDFMELMLVDAFNGSYLTNRDAYRGSDVNVENIPILGKNLSKLSLIR